MFPCLAATFIGGMAAKPSLDGKLIRIFFGLAIGATTARTRTFRARQSWTTGLNQRPRSGRKI